MPRILFVSNFFIKIYYVFVNFVAGKNLVKITKYILANLEFLKIYSRTFIVL